MQHLVSFTQVRHRHGHTSGGSRFRSGFGHDGELEMVVERMIDDRLGQQNGVRLGLKLRLGGVVKTFMGSCALCCSTSECLAVPKTMAMDGR